jgi:hypothetical protein
VLKVLDSHIIRAIFKLSYETMEVTGPQMVLVMKLTAFAWNVLDGRRPVEVCYAFIRVFVSRVLICSFVLGS